MIQRPIRVGWGARSFARRDGRPVPYSRSPHSVGADAHIGPLCAAVIEHAGRRGRRPLRLRTP